MKTQFRVKIFLVSKLHSDILNISSCFVSYTKSHSVWQSIRMLHRYKIFAFDIYLEWLNWKVQLNSNRNVISIDFFLRMLPQYNSNHFWMYTSMCSFLSAVPWNTTPCIPIIIDIQINSEEKCCDCNSLHTPSTLTGWLNEFSQCALLSWFDSKNQLAYG